MAMLLPASSGIAVGAMRFSSVSAAYRRRRSSVRHRTDACRVGEKDLRPVAVLSWIVLRP